MKVILSVCGSISAYKAYELLRAYLKEDIEVKIILTKGSLNFISKEVFKYLGASAVYSYEDDFSSHNNAHILHIDLVKWMDKLVIAPASANTIAKIASGVSDDLLTSVVLANEDKEIHIFPAMNTKMLKNSITQSNLEKLKTRSFFIHPTASGELACKDLGEGKLLEVLSIKNLSLFSSLKTKSKTITINTGATVSPLDSVRFLTNPASGKTGIELAKRFLTAGYKVNLVCGYGMKESTQYLTEIDSLKLYHEDTTEKMFIRCSNLFSKSDVYISSAAISDIKFTQSSKKLKKSDFTNSIEFTQDIDVLKEVTKTKTNQIVIGFAAESELKIEDLKKKMNSKNMDYLIANKVGNGINAHQLGFGQDENNYLILSTTEESTELTISKKELAQEIFKRVISHD